MDAVPRLGLTLPLVGRVAELRALSSALDDAERQHARGVLLSGDAGVGKTRLLAEFTADATRRGCVVLQGRCLDLREGGLPYLPFTEALSALDGLDGTGGPGGAGDEVAARALAERPALATLLTQHAGSAVGPADGATSGPSVASEQEARRVRTEIDLGQLRLYDAVLGVISDLARHRPVVLIVEDLHWADGSTRDLVSFLLGRLGRQRVVIVASYRGEDVHRGHPLRPLLAQLVRLPAVERVEVPPLTADEARAFLAALAEQPLPADRLDALVRRCEGNPFFAEELLAAGVTGDGMSDGLADVLLSRLEQLSPDARRVLGAAAVASAAVSDTAITEVTGSAPLDVEEALREAVHQHVLVVEQGCYVFRHALMRDAVYGDLLPGERSRAHAAYAARLRERERHRGQDAMLAYHSLRSRDLPTALAALVCAADEAEGLGAPGSALRHLEQALEIWDAVPAEARPPGRGELDLLLLASKLAATSGEPERAISYARAATRRMGEAPAVRRAATWRRLAEGLMTLEGTFDEAVDAIEQAWDLVADEGPSAEKAWVLGVRAQALRGVGRLDDAAHSARLAVEAARAAGAEAPHAAALATLGILADVGGDAVEARRLFAQAEREALAVGASDVELRASYYHALSYDDRGELAEALRGYRHTAERAMRTGLTWSPLGVSARTRLLAVRYLAGDWPDDIATDHPEAGVSDLVNAILQSSWVHLAVARGRFDEAERLLVELLSPRDGDRRGVDLWVVAAAAAGAAELATWRGDHREAVRVVDDGLDRAERVMPTGLVGLRIGALGVEACAAWASAVRRHGDVETASEAAATGRRLLDRVERTAERGSPRSGELGPEGRAWLWRARAAATGLDGPADPAAWERAVCEFGFGAVYEQALCRWRHGAALLEAGDRAGSSRATDMLAEAYAVAVRLHAEPLRAAVAELAGRARLDLPGLPQRRSRVELLTERERAVLERVAEGLTNRQVGEQLYISEKTVSVHLSRAMAKLGASRRAEAVALAYDRGLLSGEAGRVPEP
ncbi:LuxR family transcriptional regulator [Saccharomonospora piscinae]|uniref:LuxR family transcriptional regulator n=1 Tax=Saccharomonospora piscinae TaxID=687388 RepID=A0A1V9AAD8_SACPI|nr:helix-turn-helix transcriptional regulator [Saccharomonospora piscinae]OQO94040.1 LuxR family transcriptional regulator [Saccharomonospora piscinae]